MTTIAKESPEKLDIRLKYSFEDNIDFKNRVIRLTDEEINTQTFNRIDAAMTEMESQARSRITIKILCDGGEAYAALAIAARIKSSKCQVVTEGYGTVESAATLVLASGDKRRFSRFGWFMHHPGSNKLEGSLESIKQEAKQLDREDKHWSNIMAELSHGDSDFWYNSGRNVDAYFTAEELLELGVVDEIF